MKATITLTAKTAFEQAIERNDRQELLSLYNTKLQQKMNACDNAIYYRNAGNSEFADEETNRVNRLNRDINRLHVILFR